MIGRRRRKERSTCTCRRTSLPSWAAVVLWCVCAATVSGERVEFSDGESHTIAQNYTADNLYLSNGTTVSLDFGFHVLAPSDNDEGTEGVRVEDSVFVVRNGTITGSPTTSGTAVYVTRSRVTRFDARAVFYDGAVVRGGDPSREKTTKAGSAIIVANLGAEVVIHGGTFAPGKGCTFNTCGTVTEDGDVIQVLQGKVVIRGGSFSGNVNMVSGDLVVHGCVTYVNKRIQGFLEDGSGINIPVSDRGCGDCVKVEYVEDLCPQPEEPEDSGAGPPQKDKEALRVGLAFLLANALAFAAL